MKEMVAAVAFAAAVLGGVGWMIAGVHQRFTEIDLRLVGVERRVARVETMVEMIQQRVLPYGGAPARSDEFGGAPCDDGLPGGTPEILIGATADCGEEAR